MVGGLNAPFGYSAATPCWSSGASKRMVLSHQLADANIVASHCYTVLGWAYRSGV